MPGEGIPTTVADLTAVIPGLAATYAAVLAVAALMTGYQALGQRRPRRRRRRRVVPPVGAIAPDPDTEGGHP